MSILKDPPFFWDVYCDEEGCQETERIEVDDAPTFADVAKYVRDHHKWKNFKEDGGWFNVCWRHKE